MSYEEKLHEMQNPYAYERSSETTNALEHTSSLDQERYDRFIEGKVKERMTGVEDQGFGPLYYANIIRSEISFDDYKRGKR
jgi:hypothetical protein